MPLDQHVVRTLPQFHQGAGDDVDEAPGKFPESRRVAFTGELPCNAGRHLADTSKAPHGVVARGNVRPAQMEDIELALAARALRRSEEHTSELQSLMRISYAVFCLIKKNQIYRQ